MSEAAAVPENEFRFRVLRPEELQLTSQYRVLARLPAYHPLVHGGWVQLGLPDSVTIPVDLGVLGVTNPAGTVRLSLTRFLHVKLDLTYIDTQAAQRGLAPASGDLTELPIAPRYRIDAERTTRSGELHYFDHPAFGVLIKVTPVKAQPNTGPARPRERRLANARENVRAMIRRLGASSERPSSARARLGRRGRRLDFVFAWASAQVRQRARDDAFGLFVEAWRTSDQRTADRDVAAALRTRVVQAQLADVLGDLNDELVKVARRLADRRGNERRVVVASAEIPGTTQSAHDLRANHSLARVRRLRAERLPIGLELDDLEQQHRDHSLVAARDREIAAHELLEIPEAHEPGARIDSIEARNLLPRTAELALQQRDFDVGGRLLRYALSRPAFECRGST